MIKQYYRLNIYNDNNYGSDIEISYSFDDLPNAYDTYNKMIKQYKNVLIELVLEIQEDITGIVYTLIDNSKEVQ